MSTSPTQFKKSFAETNHSKDDVLSDQQFELLYEGASRLEEYYRLQARFVVLLAGRLGFRAGEIAHLDESWVDHREQMIEIPRHYQCRKGKNGGHCGYCEHQAEQMVAHNDGLSFNDALAMMWSPKSPAGARTVPFGHSARIQLIVERFFDRFDKFPISRVAVNRRVNRAAEAADRLDPDDVYPHGLRATAATHLAASGLEVLPLKSLMGWEELETAQSYVASNASATDRALKQLH